MGGFVLFVLLAVRVVWLERRRLPSRRAKVQLIGYALAATCITGFLQEEAWPFTTWALVHNVSQTSMLQWQLTGVDASGKGYPIDLRFIQPLPPEDFDAWMKYSFMRLGTSEEEARTSCPVPGFWTTEQRAVVQFLLDRANSARERFLRTGRPGTNGWLLGAFAAPYHFDRPRTWRLRNDVPATPFVSFEIWQERWDLEQRWRDESRVDRTLLFRYP